jgi:glucose 1-dehydrogenase
VKVIAVKGDVSSEADVTRMFAETISAFGRLDVLVNNAGIQNEGKSDQVSVADFEKILNVNLKGVFLCSREALRHFLSRPGGGVILNNTSVHEHIPKPEYLSYAVSKWGVAGLTRTLALEYAGRGIRVNSVGPGAILTPINDSWAHDPAEKANVESHIPMGRAGLPEEIASVFAFLASEDASYITGQTIFACGGLTLYPEFRDTWAS